MSAVKEFYLTRYSKCPKCGGSKLKHLSTIGTPVGLDANFKCEDCKKQFTFKDYIEAAISKIERTPYMQIFDRCYYEVNK